MLKIIFKNVLVFAFFAVHSFSAPLLEDIKGLDLTNPGYEDLNPLHGYVWNQGILENHGEMLDNKDTLRELIQLLFHRAGTFDPSTQPETNSAVPHLTPKIIGTILGTPKDKEISLKFLSENLKGGGYKNARTNINKLEKLLNELRTDSRAYRVMLALLWYKAYNKQDFASYYEGVRSKNDKAVKEIPANWPEQKFSLSDVTSSARPDFKTNYGAYLYWIAKQDADAPPLEHQGNSYISIERFPDCGETSLKNFIKLAIDRDGKYDVSVLQNLGAKDEVIKFFKDFPNREEQTTQKARNAWAKLTMNLPLVQYGFKTYEICPRTNASANMLAVLSALFNELKNVREWKEVANKIQEVRTKIGGLGDFIIENENLSDGYGTVTFAVEKFGRFDWHFQKGHFYIAPLPRKSLGDYPLIDINDIAIFYPINILPKENTLWHLYAGLRQDEMVESALRQLKKPQLTTTIKVALLNRLSTDDAKKRVFPLVISSVEDTKALIENKQFKLSMAYLRVLLEKNQFDSAKILAGQEFFLKDQGVTSYFIGHADVVVSAVFSPDGKKVLTASNDNTARIWDADTGETIKELKGHDHEFVSAVFSPDGKKVLTASWDNTARIWDADTGETIKELKGHADVVELAVFSPDGKKVITASLDNTARIWDADTGETIKELKFRDYLVTSTVFSPDGKKVLTASRDNTARIWDADTGETIKELKGHADVVELAVFSPDGKKVITASDDNTVRILDADTGETIKELKGHIKPVRLAVFSADGKKVLTASNDKTARIWDAETGETIKELKGQLMTSAVFSADGKKVITTSGDKTARIWDFIR